MESEPISFGKKSSAWLSNSVYDLDMVYGIFQPREFYMAIRFSPAIRFFPFWGILYGHTIFPGPGKNVWRHTVFPGHIVFPNPGNSIWSYSIPRPREKHMAIPFPRPRSIPCPREFHKAIRFSLAIQYSPSWGILYGHTVFPGNAVFPTWGIPYGVSPP